MSNKCIPIALLAIGWVVVAVFAISANADSLFNQTGTDLRGIQLPNHPQSIVEDESLGCDQFAANYNHKKPDSKPKNSSSVRVQLFNHHHKEENRYKSRKTLLLESLARDRSRVRAFRHRLAKSRPATAPLAAHVAAYSSDAAAYSSDVATSMKDGNISTSTVLEAHVESGVSVGSGEYFMDVFIGTPPRKFQLILDTGSDLNWVQCLPCEDCYEQEGPVFNASLSSSYRPVRCSAPECSLVTGPEDTGAAGNSTTCTKAPSSPCKYFYWYGDRSNTTGDLAFETFTVNLSSAAPVAVGGVVFGCGHANRGLFHGAAGLLGLGRGQLSFTSQLRRHYGHKFSYCLVDRNSNLSVTSTLVFGEDHRFHAADRRLAADSRLQYTAFLSGEVDTFYYLNVSSLTVGGERVNVSSHVWDVASGGVIIDSGTTLTYLAQPAYDLIQAAFESKIGYPRADFPPLGLCYNISGVADVKLPEFSIRFGDGAVWKFPAENYFIQPDPDESVVCLAVLGTPENSLSIIGNYQQQNFHILYDVDNSRLGFAPMECADL
uniref:Peptidase A1 domain-containing protein n=1 Tax=Araucaria cunninghamii TaxID=56994 RepID=A0A0D6QVJ8_ARACU